MSNNQKQPQTVVVKSLYSEDKQVAVRRAWEIFNPAEIKTASDAQEFLNASTILSDNVRFRQARAFYVVMDKKLYENVTFRNNAGKVVSCKDFGQWAEKFTILGSSQAKAYCKVGAYVTEDGGATTIAKPEGDEGEYKFSVVKALLNGKLCYVRNEKGNATREKKMYPIYELAKTENGNIETAFDKDTGARYDVYRPVKDEEGKPVELPLWDVLAYMGKISTASTVADVEYFVNAHEIIIDDHGVTVRKKPKIGNAKIKETAQDDTQDTAQGDTQDDTQDNTRDEFTVIMTAKQGERIWNLLNEYGSGDELDNSLLDLFA